MNPALESAKWVVDNVCKDVTIDEKAVHDAAIQVHDIILLNYLPEDFQIYGSKRI